MQGKPTSPLGPRKTIGKKNRKPGPGWFFRQMSISKVSGHRYHLQLCELRHCLVLRTHQHQPPVKEWLERSNGMNQKNKRYNICPLKYFMRELRSVLWICTCICTPAIHYMHSPNHDTSLLNFRGEKMNVVR